MSSQVSRSLHGLDPVQHGLSLERISLAPPHAVSSLFDGAPPLGVPFVEIIASADGHVLLVDGVRLPDNGTVRRLSARMPLEAARLVASALARAADLSQSEGEAA